MADRLIENEEILKELQAEGLSEREARKQLVNRAIEKWASKQILDKMPAGECEKETKTAPKSK